jgi:uncharacterized protein YggT (Ycf19 family)
MGQLLCALLTMAVLVIALQLVLAWIPKSYDSPWARVEATLKRLTDPVIAPVRAIMPRPAGIPIDLSYLLVSVVLFTLRSVVCS